MNALVFLFVVAMAAFIGAGSYNYLTHKYDPEGREAHARRAEKDAAREKRHEGRRETARSLGETVMKYTPLADTRRRGLAKSIRRAGWGITVGTYWVANIASVVIGFVLGALMALAMTNPNPAAHIAVFVLLVAIGALAPRLVLNSAISRRRKQIEASLPGNLELLSVVVGAGLTIESGIRTVGERTSGPMSEEFAQVSNDITYYGKTTQEALRDMADRCETQEVSLFVASMIQSMNAGSPIADILRTQAELSMDRYYMKVEEKSNTIRQKMIFPTVFFILPPIFIISIGPTVLKLLEVMPQLV